MFPNLFALYRYLSKNRGTQQPDDPYNMAYLALENLFAILAELDLWGKSVSEQGGLEYEHADTVFKVIIGGHKTAVCEAYDQSAAKALVAFANTHVNLTTGDYDAIIVGLQAQRSQQLDDAKLQKELEEIDDIPW